MASASFTRRVATTYATFVGANALSNLILFPDKKLDYGYLNQLLGREVNSPWWGTRLEHVVGIALPLAVCDHASIDLWNKVLLRRFGYAAGVTLSFAATPGPLLIHGATFAFAGIMIYVAIDAALSPLHEGKRWEAITSKVYPEVRGVHTMWTLPITTGILSTLVGRPVPHGTLLGFIPPALAFTTVKGHSMPWPWNGAANLTAYERKMNGIDAAGNPLPVPSTATATATATATTPSSKPEGAPALA